MSDFGLKKKARFPDSRGLRATDKALLCLIDGEEVWVPQSQIDDDSEVWRAGDEGHLVVSSWWAQERGLI